MYKVWPSDRLYRVMFNSSFLCPRYSGYKNDETFSETRRRSFTRRRTKKKKKKKKEKYCIIFFFFLRIYRLKIYSIINILIIRWSELFFFKNSFMEMYYVGTNFSFPFLAHRCQKTCRIAFSNLYKSPSSRYLNREPEWIRSSFVFEFDE